MAVWLGALELSFCGYSLYKETVPGAVNLDAEFDTFLVDNATKVGAQLHNHTHTDSHPGALFKDCHLADGIGKAVGIKMWIYVQMGLAAVNLIFAPYFQCRLWSKLNQEANEPG